MVMEVKKYTTLDVCSSDFGVNVISHFLCLNFKVFAFVFYSGVRIRSGSIVFILKNKTKTSAKKTSPLL